MVFGVLAGVTLFWFALGAFSFWNVRGAAVLRPDQPTAPLSPAPKVSILVAARNEEESLPTSLASLLKLDYADYEVLLVDDDSRDRTGLIADEWASKAEPVGRLKVLHNRRLPAGWCGKVHALNLAARAATGEWILATDADLVFHPAILRLGMGWALENKLQLLSLAPELEFGSVWERAVLPSFFWLIATLFPPRLANHPKFPRALAVGAFILMRRADLEALGGYERLKTTVIEDVRMAELFKRNGRRIYVGLTRGLFRTRMYKSWRELWEGLTRTSFEGSGFSVLKILASVAVGTIAGVWPSVAVIVRLLRDGATRIPPLQDTVLLGALAACAASMLVYCPVLRYFRLPARYVLALPLAALFYSLVAIDSMLLSIIGGGVPWKGRRYRPPA
jgi:chlorobactene glucosyltransferase